MEVSITQGFAHQIRSALGQLGWSQQQLSERAKISKAQISGWLAGERSVSRDHVNRLAHVFAAAYEVLEPRQRGEHPDWETSGTEWVLRDLLLAAGFSAVDAAERDIVWNRICNALRQRSERPRLVAGWVRYPQIANDPYNPKSPGFAVELTRHISQLMHVDLEWKQCAWDEVVERLERREIDLVAPVFARMPDRMFRVRFSRGIPGFDLRLNGILHEDHRAKVVHAVPRVEGELPGNPGHSPMPPMVDEVVEERLLVTYMAGESAATMKTLMLSNADTEQLVVSAMEACEDILQTPTRVEQRTTPVERVRCFIADDWYIRQLKRELQAKRLRPALLYQRPPDEWPRPMLAFAVHESEGRLMEVINECLQIMGKCGHLQRLKERYDLKNYSRTHSDP